MRPVALGVVLVLAASLLLPAVAGDAKPAAEQATAYNTQRKVARDATGSIYVAYVQSGIVPRVLVAHSRDDGHTWADLQPPTTPGQPSDRASLVVNSQGTLHLAWTETAGEDRQVFYAALRQGTWGARVQLSQTNGYSGFPSLTLDSRERVHVVWYGFEAGAYQVHYRVLEGGQWSSVQRLTASQLDALNPALAVDRDDGLHVAYYRLNGVGATTGVFYFSSRPTWGTPLLISTPGVESADPTLAVDGRGTIHVAWSALQGNDSMIVYRNLTAGAWSSPAILSAPGGGAEHPSLAVDAGGHVYVLWNQVDGQIYLAKWDRRWSQPEALTHAGRNTYPTTRWAMFGDGSPRVDGLDYAWTQEIDGGRRLAFASLGSPGTGGVSGAGSALVPLPYVALGAAGAALVVGVAAVVHRRRRP